MSEAEKEIVPAFRVTTYQNEGNVAGKYAIRCGVELLTEIPAQETAAHFAAIIRTIFEGAKEMDQGMGTNVHEQLVGYVNSGGLRSIGKSRSVYVDDKGNTIEQVIDHGTLDDTEEG